MRGSKTKGKYDRKYFDERDQLQMHLVNVIENIAKKNKLSKLLEVGVGSGKLMKKLRKDGFNIQGFDKSPIAAKMAGAKVGSATKIPFRDNSFDFVIAISIIEHLTEKEGRVFAQELNRVLKKNGVVFMVTPNFASPLRVMFGKKWAGYVDKTHVYFYTPLSLRRLLKKYGFDSVKFFFKITIPVLEWPLPAFFHKLPNPIKLGVNYLLANTPIAFLARDTFWISARKTNDL